MWLHLYKYRLYLHTVISKAVAKCLGLGLPPAATVCGILERDGKILVLKHTYINGYGLPGGRLENNDTIEETLLKEFQEETSLTVTKFDWLFSTVGYQYQVCSVQIVFKVECEGELNDSEEGTLHWMIPEELVDKMAYINANKAVKKYCEYRKQNVNLISSI